MADSKTQWRRFFKRPNRSDHEQPAPDRDYARAVARGLLKYGVAYPLYGCVWVLTVFCFTGRQPLSGGFYCGNGRREAARREYDMRRKKINAPRPLYRHKVKGCSPAEQWPIDERAIARRRRLSFDGNAQASRLQARPLRRAKGTKEGQTPTRCRLLELPAEIRTQIWQYAAGNCTIHILSGTPVDKQPYIPPYQLTLRPIRIRRTCRDDKLVRRLRSVECRSCEPSLENCVDMGSCIACSICGLTWGKYGEYSGLLPSSDLPCPTPREKPTSNLWNPLALLVANRQIYMEAIPLLYSTNTFYFTALYQVSDFVRSILPHRVAQIQRVMLRSWMTDHNDYRVVDTLLANFLALKEINIAEPSSDLGSLSVRSWMFEHVVRLAIEMQKRRGKSRVIYDPGFSGAILQQVQSTVPGIEDAGEGLEIVNMTTEERLTWTSPHCRYS